MFAQTDATGPQLYRTLCAGCHGDDGRGQGQSRPPNTVPFDFSDCGTATAEPDGDWRTVITRGGPAAGLSPAMPAFSILAADQIDELIRYLRTFCRDRSWPSGNLNFPRALFTAKAFPENETMLRPIVAHSSSAYAQVRLETSYETRIGRRGEIEISLPVATVGGAGGRVVGLGDVALQGKYVLAARPSAGIVSAGIEMSIQTGSHRWAFGEGTTVFEPFVAAGARWSHVFLQADVRALLPVRRFPFEPIHHVAYNVSVSTAFGAVVPDWTVGFEVSGLDSAGVGFTPQVLKRLTPSGALTAGFGVRIVVTPPRPYVSDDTRWTGYVIWDYLEPIRRRR